MALSIQPKFPVQPVEMQMERAVEILRNKRTTLGGTPLFSFQPVGTESTVPSGQNFYFYCSRICLLLHQLLEPSRSTNEIASFSPAWKKRFLLSRKIFGISNRKFWLNGQHPTSITSLCNRRLNNIGRLGLGNAGGGGREEPHRVSRVSKHRAPSSDLEGLLHVCRLFNQQRHKYHLLTIHNPLDSEDDFRSGCRNVSQSQ